MPDTRNSPKTVDEKDPGKENVQAVEEDGDARSKPPGREDKQTSEGATKAELEISGRDGKSELPLDQVFEVLKNKRRREVLHYLKRQGGSTTLSDVAEHIAAMENDTTVSAITSTQRKRVYVGLYQCHLPKMDDMDVIDFDKNRGTVELSSNADQVESYLGSSDDSAWYRVYLGLAIVGAGLFIASVSGGAQYGLRPAVVLVILLGGMFLCAGAQAGVLNSILPDNL